MGIKLTKLPELSPEKLTESESHLWLLLREREECIQELKDEIARLKGEKGKPKIKPSRLEPEKKAQGQQEETEEEAPQDNQAPKKRPGSEKRQKTANLMIHETKVIAPTEEIHTGTEFKGYQDYTVQELIVSAHNTLYRLAIWKTPTGEYLKGKLPDEVRCLGHFGVILRSYLLYEYHHCHVTQPKLLKQMGEWGIDISAGQLNRILVEDKDKYHAEKQDILRVGLRVSSYINTDDTSARHQGVNSYCTQIGNEWFASLGRHSFAEGTSAGSDRWFETTRRKNRINFLELLRGQRTDYVLSSEALTYMREHKLPQSLWLPISLSINRVFQNQEEWLAYLKEVGIFKDSHVKMATEGVF